MSDMPDLLPVIRAVGGDPADLPFWEACLDGRFLVHRCETCGQSYWPASRCITHGLEAMVWLPASGRAHLHNYTVLHHAFTPGMQDKTPYVVGVVKLEEGPLFHTNIVGTAPSEVAIDMPLEVVMAQAREDGLVLPMFRPARV